MARMSCHRVHQALCLLTLAVAGAGFSVASARAADLGEQIRAVKAARSEVELRQRLEQLGFSRGLVDKAAAAKDAYGKSVFKLEQLKRAEMWEVNLDPDADKERVVQVLLKSESEMMQFTSLYLILVLDSQAQGGKVLTENFPKPGIVTSSPCCSDSATVSKTDLIRSDVCCLVTWRR